MITEWHDFLAQAGAVMDGALVVHFGDPDGEQRAAVEGDVLCDLSHQGLIAASGADAQTFLQGQLTNDVRQVSAEHSQLGALCSPKGRMLACFRVFRHGESYYLRMPQERVGPILQRLRLFVLRAKVVVEDAGAVLLRIGLSGPGAEEHLQDVLGAVPAQVDGVMHDGRVTVIRVPGIAPRFEIYGDLQTLQGLWAALAPRVVPAGAESWRLLDILAGVPNVYDRTADAFVPQMVNLQLINGVSFRKGCYTGQEVVARTQHLGRLKRRMYRARVFTDHLPEPGAEVVHGEGGVGRVVDACRHPDGGCEVLAVVPIEYAEGGVGVYLAGAAALEFEPLPYALPA